MIITLEDGTTQDLAFSPANCKGIQAAKVEVNATDLEDMVLLAASNFHKFSRAMSQLAAGLPRPREKLEYDPRITEAARRSREGDWS